MSTWKIYTSTTEALMNETANYKNGETTQETFNQKMLSFSQKLMQTFA